MQLLELGKEVLARRELEGIRGIDREKSRFRCHIASSKLATMDVEKIRKAEIKEWIFDMGQKQALGPGEERKLARPTVSRCKSLLSTILREAVDRELVEKNWCDEVTDKKRVDESDTKIKWAYLSADEQRLIADCEEIPRWVRLMILIATDTGMRQGEQHHLRLQDVVLDDASPHINIRVAGRTKAGKLLPPKSGKPRTVPLLPDGVAHFREWLAMLPAYAPDNPHGIVFPTASGTYRQQGKPLGRSDTFRLYLAKVGITRRVRWHDLRHTFCTNGIVLYGWPIEIVQGLAGHSSVMITQRYAHVGDDALKSAIRKTTEALAQAAARETIEVPQINEVVEVETPTAALVVREPARLPQASDPGLLSRVVGRVGRLFGRAPTTTPERESSHAV